MNKNISKAFALAFFTLSFMSCNSNSGSVSPANGENAVLQNILNRKSVRKYTDQALSEEQIETLLRAGMAAPSGMNVQPWSFVVITDKEVASKLVSSKVNTMYAEAPCLIVVCGETTVMRRPRGEENAEPVAVENGNWTADCAAVTENILLAAESMGLGAVWTAAYPYEERYGLVKEVLGLPENVLPYAVIPVGYPAENPAPKDKWKPEKIHRNRW